MALRKRLLYAGLTVALYFWNPWSIGSRVTGAALSALQPAGPTRDTADSLKAAMANVTTDFDHLALLVQGFFERLPDNATEQLFRDYLQARARQSHKEFERFLDWLLNVYNIILWPFVVMLLITRLSGAGGGREHEGPHAGELQRRESLARRPPLRHGLRDSWQHGGPEAPRAHKQPVAASVSEGDLAAAAR